MSKALIIRGANFYNNRVDVVNFLEQVPCTGLSLSDQSISFDALGDTDTIIATATPVNTTDEIVWSSSNDNVATVQDGVITCTGIGTATITAICGQQEATCSIEYLGASYIQNNGGSYILTDISESENPFDYEAVLSNDLSVADYSSAVSGNGHVLSSANVYYPSIKLNETYYIMLVKINGTETQNVRIDNYVAGTFLKETVQKSGSNYNVVITSEDGATTLAEASNTIGSTYNTSNKFVLFGYGRAATTARFRLHGKVKYIKLYNGQNLAYNFIAAKKKISANNYVYGLFESVNRVFYQSDGDPFVGA